MCAGMCIGIVRKDVVNVLGVILSALLVGSFE
jgi:hypothetical protein